MAREEDFLALQKKLLVPLVGDEAAQFVEDYYEAGLPSGVFAMLSGKNVIEDSFLRRRVLGDSITERIERHHLEVSAGGGFQEEESRILYEQFVRDFNPDVVYAAFTFPAIVHEEGLSYNLFVLRRSSLREGEGEGVVERTNDLLEVLGYSDQFYRYKNRADPWKGLIQELQGISLRAEPMQNAEFGKTGRVLRWVENNEYTRAGMLVDSLDDTTRTILRNAANKKKFGHLNGELVRYHVLGFEGFGFPYGELVATSLGSPVDNPLQLPIPK